MSQRAIWQRGPKESPEGCCFLLVSATLLYYGAVALFYFRAEYESIFVFFAPVYHTFFSVLIPLHLGIYIYPWALIGAGLTAPFLLYGCMKLSAEYQTKVLFFIQVLWFGLMVYRSG